MTIESLLRDYSSFNVWANVETVNWLKSKPLELMEVEMTSSFPTIKLTLLHIWGAEKNWLERLQQVPSPVFLSQTFEGSTPEVFDGLLKASANMEAFVHALDAEALQSSCDFRLLNGTEDRRVRSEMIHHCLNHSTYHRGQIVTMARTLGLTDPPSTDFMRFLRVR
jgi:uncharacterized damage-inducible protein DinB